MRLKKGIISIVLILAVIAGGLSAESGKVQASDADLGFEPYVTDYATHLQTGKRVEDRWNL